MSWRESCDTVPLEGSNEKMKRLCILESEFNEIMERLGVLEGKFNSRWKGWDVFGGKFNEQNGKVGCT